MDLLKGLVKKYQKWTITTILILLLTIIIGIIIFQYNNNQEFKLEMEVIKETKDNYNIEINYPVLNNKGFNKKITNLITTEKNNFKQKIKDIPNTSNELRIDYDYTLKDNIYSIHLLIYSYTGQNNEYYHNDKIFYINKATNQELSLSDLVNSDIYTNIKEDCKNYLTNKKIPLYEDNVIEQALDNLADFALLAFSEEEMFVIIPPYKVSDNEMDININIKYNKIKDDLNTKYFTFAKDEDYQVSGPTTNNQERNLDNFKNKKLLAITFDDGPNYKVTKYLIDELEKRNARVTFFMVGNRINSQKELVKEIYEKGHTIGSHSYDHKSLTKLKENQLKQEIDTTNEIIQSITGETVKYLRPPYGNYNKDILNEIDMTFILWNVDTEDWKSKDKDKVCNHIITHANDGNIILLHDLYQTSVDGALCAIDKLKNEGYEFVTIEEMAKIKGIELKNHTAYRYIK